MLLRGDGDMGTVGFPKFQIASCESSKAASREGRSWGSFEQFIPSHGVTAHSVGVQRYQSAAENISKELSGDSRFYRSVMHVCMLYECVYIVKKKLLLVNLRISR